MKLDEYLLSCRELTQLCTQNGWIDNDTLRYEVLERSPGHITATVGFEEVLMEGAGCVAGRVPCYGKVRVDLNGTGEPEKLTVLWPSSKQ